MPIAKTGLTTGDFAPRLQDLPACLDMFEKFGVDSVELSMAAFDTIWNGRAAPNRAAELKRICADRPFGFTVHGPVTSSFTDRRHIDIQKDVCRATLDVAAEIGATAQVHHGGAVPVDDKLEAARLRAYETEAFAEMAHHASERGVVLCVENIFAFDPKIEMAAPHELAEQVKAVNSPFLRATIDFSHAAINAGNRGFDLMTSLAALAPVAGHLHIHDSFGKPKTIETFTYGEMVNYGMGDLHLPPGWGALDWSAIAALPYSDVNIVANLELGKRFEDQVPASIEHVRNMIAKSG
ncbi:MAG: sugar phosphate isomerase/epimerase [Neomegalonema sp.]|nr:sugar phosphate isomerase/epimerase [Neomegalonema sp.]